MEIALENSVVLQKTRELCETILAQPEYRSLRQRIDAFMADDRAKQQYQSLAEMGDALHHKQHEGVRLSPEEIAAYEKHREALSANPVASGFIEAQQQLGKVQETVSQYVTKTFELGRVPTEADFDDGSCGHGCGCHH